MDHGSLKVYWTKLKETIIISLLRSILYQATHKEEMVRLHDGTIKNINQLFPAKTLNPTTHKKIASKYPTVNPDVFTYK